MSETNIIPEPWGAFLRELDEIATESVDFHCIGGFVITKRYGFLRETSDVERRAGLYLACERAGRVRANNG